MSRSFNVIFALLFVLNQFCFSWNLNGLKNFGRSILSEHQVTIKKTLALGITLASLTNQPNIAISAVGEGTE